MSDGAAELQQLIAERLAEARAAWPGVELDDDLVTDYVLERSGDPGDAEAVAAANWSELYLVCACGVGDSRALAAFDEHYLSLVPGAVASMALSAGDVDDVCQRIREKLFVAEPDQRPRIDRYSGGGSLHGLVKVMAVREAISIVRKRTREVWDPDDDLLRLPSHLADPELDAVKDQLRDQFRRAFELAVTELTPRERNLLRMHILEGATLEQLATSYSVHRVTITRWLARARSTLLAATRRQLEREAKGAGVALESFFQLIESRLDLSLSRLLRTD